MPGVRGRLGGGTAAGAGSLRVRRTSGAAGGGVRKRLRYLRSDTVMVPVGGGEEVYLWSLPACCREAVKDAIRGGSGRLAELRCGCGRRWRVASSLDELVLERFETLEKSMA